MLLNATSITSQYWKTPLLFCFTVVTAISGIP